MIESDTRYTKVMCMMCLNALNCLNRGSYLCLIINSVYKAKYSIHDADQVKRKIIEVNFQSTTSHFRKRV